ncbi:hypothetical protein GCM10010339_00440 [Streptomyces alanosinicus]|uniref:MFS transporter n=1 Tax=Streptomyces alanosinicus TaxID=68171 RepID=A0A919CZ47_9ACTN|nr:hypothetical protein GCM10010339_00440 [Streptomyces alanosinicus]
MAAVGEKSGTAPAWRGGFGRLWTAADRVDQRRAMWAVDTVRGLLVAGFALLVGLGQASIPLLLALAFALTTLQTLFDNAATALLPSLVDRADLGGANARLVTGQQISADHAPRAAPSGRRSARACARCGATGRCGRPVWPRCCARSGWAP